MLFLTNQLVSGRSFLKLFVPCFLALAASVSAQISDGGLGDSGVRGANNTIQGHIFEPSGRRFENRVQVRISSIRGIDFSTMTDENGSFSFRRLPGGTYFVTVDVGKLYMPVSETVHLSDQVRNQSGTTHILQIKLQTRATTEGGPGVLNAAFVGVPKAALDFYTQAGKAAQAGDSKKAIELLKRAIELHPEFAPAHNELGVQHFKLGELQSAATSFTEAIRLSPNMFSPHLNYGIVLFYKKQFQSAGDELDRALKITETSAIAHLFRGRCFIKTNDFPKAEVEFRRALSLGGDAQIDDAHRFLAGIYNEQGKFEQAAHELETYLKLRPKAPDAEQLRALLKEIREKASTSKK